MLAKNGINEASVPEPVSALVMLRRIQPAAMRPTDQERDRADDADSPSRDQIDHCAHRSANTFAHRVRIHRDRSWLE
jgi:hypothetical protein